MVLGIAIGFGLCLITVCITVLVVGFIRRGFE